MLNSLEFFFGEAWTSVKRNGIMSFVAIGTVIVSLTVFGVFLMGVVNIGRIVGSISSSAEVSAYVNSPLEQYQAESISKNISRLRGVGSVRYVSRDKAWNAFKDEYGKRLELDDAVDENPLPDTFVINVVVPDLVPEVAKQVSAITGISEVRYSGSLLDQVQVLASAVRIGGLILVCMLSVATLLIVMNTIRLTVIAREKDIAIMKLVGATNSFIKWPFIIEGIMIGCIGSAFSFVILNVSYEVVIFQLSQALPFLPLVSDQTNLFAVYLIVGCVGIVLGMLGGYISVSKSLRELN